MADSAVKIGITLPTFAGTFEPVLSAARTAEDSGLDGVFSFDHLWPMGRPGRPAMWSFAALGAVAAGTARITVGPLVARIGLRSDDDLVASFEALAAVAGRRRVIAALGSGDRLSASENEAYGVGYPPVAERLTAIGEVVDRLRARGFATWVGGTSDGVARIARDHGAGRNLWGATVADVAHAAAGDGLVPLVTWGGQVLIGRDDGELADLRDRYGQRPGLVSGTIPEVARRLAALHGAGARWCVCAPLDHLARPERAVETLGLVAEAVR